MNAFEKLTRLDPERTDELRYIVQSHVPSPPFDI